MNTGLFSMVLPTMIVEFLEFRGLSTAQAWSATGALLGALTFLSIVITAAVSKKKDPPCEKEDLADTSASRDGTFVILRIFKFTILHIIRGYPLGRFQPISRCGW